MYQTCILPLTALMLMATFNAYSYYDEPNNSKDSHITADVSHSSHHGENGMRERTGNASFHITEDGKEHNGTAQGKITKTGEGEYHIEGDVKKLNKKQIMSMLKKASKDFKSNNKQTAQANDIKNRNTQQGKKTSKQQTTQSHQNTYEPAQQNNNNSTPQGAALGATRRSRTSGLPGRRTTTSTYRPTLKREFCWFCTVASKARKRLLVVVTTGFSVFYGASAQ